MTPAASMEIFLYPQQILIHRSLWSLVALFLNLAFVKTPYQVGQLRVDNTGQNSSLWGFWSVDIWCKNCSHRLSALYRVLLMRSTKGSLVSSRTLRSLIALPGLICALCSSKPIGPTFSLVVKSTASVFSGGSCRPSISIQLSSTNLTSLPSFAISSFSRSSYSILHSVGPTPTSVGLRYLFFGFRFVLSF